jgi:hypothetical protein
MRKVKGVIFIILLLLFVDWIYFRTGTLTRQFSLFTASYFLIISLLIFVLINGIIYGKLFSFRSSVPRILVFLCLSLGISLFLSGRILDIGRAYDRYKNAKTVFNQDRIYRMDRELGFAPRPNATGYDYFNIGDSITGMSEVRFDSDGFRIPHGGKSFVSDTGDLFLGCSFTFSQYVKPEEGYPYLLASRLGHDPDVAARPAYGLGQMYVLADSLTKRKPYRYVILQYSPWLAERSVNYHAGWHSGYASMPYFAKVAPDSFVLEPPPYFNKDVREKAPPLDARRSYLSKLRYGFTEGIKFQVGGYFRDKLVAAKILVGLIPEGTSDKRGLEKFVYTHAVRSVRNSGAIPVIVKMWYNPGDTSHLAIARAIGDQAIFVDADAALDSVARDSGIGKADLYGIYVEQNGKRIYYDNHPNPLAHSIIAERIHRELMQHRAKSDTIRP